MGKDHEINDLKHKYNVCTKLSLMLNPTVHKCLQTSRIE